MRIFIVLFIIVFHFCFHQANAQIPTESKSNILFAGNSLTKYEKNHTLEILKEFLKEDTLSMVIDDFTKNGATLWFLLYGKMTSKYKGYLVKDLAESDLYNRINNGNFDLIIVQQDSYDSLSRNFSRPTGFYESLPIMDSLAMAKSIDLVVFEKYGTFNSKHSRRANDSYFENEYESILSKKGSLKMKIPDLKFIPTAYIIKEYRQTFPKAKFSIGGSHPSKNIQFLLACIFYKYLTGKDAQRVDYNYKLKPDNADVIKRFVDEAYSNYYNIYPD